MKKVKFLFAGIVGGFLGNSILGLLFSLPFIKDILYNPSLQSRLFIEITPLRNMPVSVIGLVILSALHGYFYDIFYDSIPGKTSVNKGLFWGFAIWSLYWVFQEWFVYHTLLMEPLILNILELLILLFGSLIEGLAISYLLRKKSITS